MSTLSIILNFSLPGFIIGFVYMFISITSMILVSRALIMNSPSVALSGILGSILAQIILAGLALLGVKSFKYIFTSDSFHQSGMIIGIIVVVIISYKFWNAKAKRPEDSPPLKKDMISTFLQTFTVSISAFGRIIGYLAFFSGFGLHSLGKGSEVENSIFILFGLCLGLIIWWLMFVLIINIIKKRVKNINLNYFQKTGAVILMCLALFMLVSLFLK